MTPCPRCGRENPASALACAGCGTPVAFGEEPHPSRLDTMLDLDRRSRRPGATPEPERPEPPADAETEEAEPGLDDPVEGMEPEGSGPDLRPAPPARRVAAWAIDGALVAAAGVALPALVLWVGSVPPGTRQCFFGSGLGSALLLSEAFVAVVAWVYATTAHALAGATLGKRVARIRVVAEDGLPPTPAVSAARSSWAIVSIAAFGLGLVPALIPPSRRALHDLLAGTRVVEGP